jgi:hypothetical protein
METPKRGADLGYPILPLLGIPIPNRQSAQFLTRCLLMIAANGMPFAFSAPGKNQHWLASRLQVQINGFQP